MAELAGIVISADTLLILGAYIFFTGIIIYFYRFSNKRLMKKIMELKRKEKDMYSLIEKINAARVREHKEAGKRLDALEEKVGVLLKPEGNEKELEREKVLLRGYR